MTTNEPQDTPSDGPTPPPYTPGDQVPHAGATPPPGYSAPPPGGYAPPPPGGYAPPPAPGYGYGPAAPLSDSDQRMWALIAHLLPILSLSFVPPLVIWLIFKDRGRFVEEQAKEALNFQITLLVAAVAATILTVVTFGLLGFIWFVFIVPLIFMIMAAVAVSRGEPYRYPLNIRFIK